MLVRRMHRHWLYLLLALLAVVGGSIGALVAQRSQGVSPAVQALPAKPQLTEEEREALIPRIPLDEARAKLGQPDVVFVDTRALQDYQTARIPGALPLPVTEIAQRVAQLPQDKQLILYCA